MPAIASAVETQRQESLFCYEGSLSEEDVGGEGAVKVEVVLRMQVSRQSHSLVGVRQVQVQLQVHILHLSYRCSVKARWIVGPMYEIVDLYKKVLVLVPWFMIDPDRNH